MSFDIRFLENTDTDTIKKQVCSNEKEVCKWVLENIIDFDGSNINNITMVTDKSENEYDILLDVKLIRRPKNV